MENEVIAIFMGEFSSPSVNFDNKGNSITPSENRMYLNRIEGMRIEFIQVLSELTPTMQKIYLDELFAKREEIIKRGYVRLDYIDLVTFAEYGDGMDGRLMLSLKNLDDGLLKILDKTIASIKAIAGEQGETQAKLQESQQSLGNKTGYPDVISGTAGLKNYLGCSHNKAFDIIKSRILPPDVQYMTGRVWKFNRKRLDEFIAKHPEILGKVRKGGVIG